MLLFASLILRFLGEFGGGLEFLAAFTLLWFYNVLFEVLYHGATPGKKRLGIRVMNVNGTPVGWRGSIIRNLIRFVDVLPGTYLFGCVSVLLSRRFQRLGDLAAGTIVVYQPKVIAATREESPQTAPVKVPLTLDEQQAIVSFGERAPRISADRGEELARLVEPVFGKLDAATLRAHANWLLRGGHAP